MQVPIRREDRAILRVTDGGRTVDRITITRPQAHAIRVGTMLPADLGIVVPDTMRAIAEPFEKWGLVHVRDADGSVNREFKIDRATLLELQASRLRFEDIVSPDEVARTVVVGQEYDPGEYGIDPGKGGLQIRIREVQTPATGGSRIAADFVSLRAGEWQADGRGRVSVDAAVFDAMKAEAEPRFAGSLPVSVTRDVVEIV